MWLGCFINLNRLPSSAEMQRLRQTPKNRSGYLKNLPESPLAIFRPSYRIRPQKTEKPLEFENLRGFQAQRACLRPAGYTMAVLTDLVFR
jgi:hypothetical protein